MSMSDKDIFRFAPSPNGALHLGHAYSALLNRQMADKAHGTMLLRLEDIDTTRCTTEYEMQMLQDLHWLGIQWSEPVRRQSAHFDDYRQALDRLQAMQLLYPAFMTRGDIRKFVAAREGAGIQWPRDPDGAPHYPGVERQYSTGQRQDLIGSGKPFAWRLDVKKACAMAEDPIFWEELGRGPIGQTGRIKAEPFIWGDVILARKDVPTSYHLSVVVDDALQGVSDIVRGHDLFHATSMHRLLQCLLELPTPRYHHHRLLQDGFGRKLSKSDGDTSIRQLRARGLSADDVLALCESSQTI
tara:strand:- start:49912 stop:50808 length:897 start_codon:yes stop_codon:yes gene_type:complete